MLTVEPLTFTSVGMPCHKYVIRNITPTDEKKLAEFSKSFLAAYQRIGTTKSDALSLLSVLSDYAICGTNTIRLDFFTYKGTRYTPEQLMDAFVKQGVLSFSCQSIAQKIDKSCSFCSMCKYSKQYANYLYREELSLLKFIFSSEDHYKLAFSTIKLSDLAFLFQSKIDLGDLFTLKKGFYIPALRILAQSIHQSSILFFQDIFGDVWLQLSDTIEGNIEDFMKLPKQIKSYSNYKIIYVDYFRNLIENADTISEEMFHEIYTKLKNREAYIPEISLEDYVCDTVSRKKSIELPTQSAQAPITFGYFENFYTSEQDETEPLILDPVSEQLSESISTTLSIETPVETNEVLDCPSSTDELPTDISTEMYYHYSSDNYIEEDLIACKTISWDELNNCTIFLDNNLYLLPHLEQLFYKEKIICMDIVRDPDDNYVHIYYDHIHKKFYSTYFEEESVILRLRPFIEKRAFTKITSHPYLLFATSRMSNTTSKNIFSIMRACWLITGKYDSCDWYIRDLLNITFDNSILHIMTHYVPAYRRCNALLADMNLQLQMSQYSSIDEALGYSYLYQSYMASIGAAFYYNQNQGLVFNKDYPKVSLVRGSIVQYQFLIEQGESISSSACYNQLLLRLAEKGHFRKNYLQVIYLNQTEIYFFIPAACYEFISTIISLELFEIAKDYQLKQVNILSHCRKTELYLS